MGSLQTARQVEVTTPLGADALLFRRMTATEELARPFEFELELLSDDHDLDLEQVLGDNMSVRLDVADDGKRYFDGVVTRFAHTGTSGDHAVYRATLRPWFWLLTRSADCRIFQEKSVPDIVKEIFRDRGFSDFEEKLSESYAPLEYSVQYRESDFDYISRLLEREGIYYYFKHEKGSHTLVLCDSYSAHEAADGYGNVPFRPPGSSAEDEREIVQNWQVAKEVQPSTCILSAFDFEQPTSSLEVKSALKRGDKAPELEVYDYCGDYIEKDAGETYARTHLEELQARYERTSGLTNARGLAAGGLFELCEYPRGDQNREYLIVRAVHELTAEGYTTGGGGVGPVYSGHIEAISSDETFRPARITPRPVIQGPQTAIVVGKSGEEIWTDEHGRVKVQFHWDRLGESDEKSSCWVRVAQVWAGKKFGALFLPRIDQEVVVEFLEGDPDRPLVTGSVYNGDHNPPHALPGKATQSGFLSRSSKKGAEDGGNALRFEDEKGKEELYLRAEKDHLAEIGNDRMVEVGNDDELNVKKKLLIKAGDEITLKCGQSEIKLEKNGTISIKGMKIQIDGKTKIEIKSSAQVGIKGAQTKIEGTMIEVKGSAMTKVAGAMLDLKGDGIAKLKGGVTMIG